jgi:hypothetical protein
MFWGQELAVGDAYHVPSPWINHKHAEVTEVAGASAESAGEKPFVRVLEVRDVRRAVFVRVLDDVIVVREEGKVFLARCREVDEVAHCAYPRKVLSG